MADEILTDAAAEFLGVTKVAIYKLIREEKIKAEKKGRDFRVDKKSLEEYKKNRRPAGRPLGTVSTKPPKNRAGTGEAAEREREYQRDYKRRLRAGELTTTKKGSGRSSATQKLKRGTRGSGK
ncbi:MAG TPA: helix-turn-helix domain-containing protein [Blastocatellia bacterium]|nr:helix-turn-helix domain-containing protein [Blastocatellia bacterium]